MSGGGGGGSKLSTLDSAAKLGSEQPTFSAYAERKVENVRKSAKNNFTPNLHSSSNQLYNIFSGESRKETTPMKKS